MKKKEFFNIYDDIGRTVKHQSFEFDGASAQYRYDVILDTDGNVYQIEQHRGYGKSDIWTEEEYELLTCSYEQAIKQIKRYAKNQERKSRITESRFGRYLNEKQNISGGGTIVPGQVPATYKDKANFNFAGYDILDYGCGTGTGKEYIKAHNKEERFAGTKVFNYEPYPKYHVDERQKFIASSNPKKMICCNNVLNVIDDDLTDILTEIKDYAKRGKVSEIIFKIYQGNKSGKGKQTGKDKYQRNEKTANYIPKIRKVFTGWDIDERPFKTYFIRLSKGKLNESFLCEESDFELSLEDIGDLAQEVFMRSDELAMPDGKNGFIRLLNNDMIRKLTNLGFDIVFNRGCLVINNVYEDDWKESILLLNLKKADYDWYEDEDTGLFLRYNKNTEYLEIGCDSAFEAIDVDIYSNWEAIARYMEKRIAKDDLDDYADEDGNPAFWCILDRHLDEFENAVLDYAELNSRFINKLKQIRKKF